MDKSTDNVVERLRALVDRDGIVQVASMLGHRNTQTIYRWLSHNKIPTNYVIGLSLVLDKIENGANNG